VKDIGVVTVVSAAFIQRLRCDAFDLPEKLVQKPCVGEAFRPLSFQALELYAENRSLPLGKPVVGPVDQMIVKPPSGHPAAVVDRSGFLRERIVFVPGVRHHWRLFNTSRSASSSSWS